MFELYPHSPSSYNQPPISCSCFDCYNQHYHSTIESPDYSYQPSSSTLERNNESWSLLDDDLAMFSKSTFRVLDLQNNDGVAFDEKSERECDREGCRFGATMEESTQQETTDCSSKLVESTHRDNINKPATTQDELKSVKVEFNEIKILIQQILELMKQWDRKMNCTTIVESSTQQIQQEIIETTKEEVYGVRCTNEHKVFDEMTERQLNSANKEAAPVNIIAGSQAGVVDSKLAWIDGEATPIIGQVIHVKLTNGKQVVASTSKDFPKDIEAPPGGVNDMIKLSYLPEPGIMKNLPGAAFGESSGAGETETTKMLIRYLAYLGGRAGVEGRTAKQQHLESNPVLDVFGNARTSWYNNSSRLRKFAELQFDKRKLLLGEVSHHEAQLHNFNA